MKEFRKRALSPGAIAIVIAGGALGWWRSSAGWLLGAVLFVLVWALPWPWRGRRRTLARVAEHLGGDRSRRLSDLEDLACRVRGARTVPGGEQVGLKCAAQFDSANRAYLQFARVLESRFNPAELTYRRYLQAAEQLYLGVQDGLQNAAERLALLGSADLDQLRGQVRTLRRRVGSGPGVSRELTALEERVRLAEAELEEASANLAGNEEALAAMGRASSALAAVKTSQGRAGLDRDDAMRQLERLAERAGRYALADVPKE